MRLQLQFLNGGAVVDKLAPREWFLDTKLQQAQYMNLVNNATIPHNVKDYLRYIASKCSWAGTKDPSRSYGPCFATQDVQEIQMDRSSDFITKSKRKALELGWIQVKKRQGTSDQIFPTVGWDDPTMKRRSPREKWLREDLQPQQLDLAP